MLVDYFKLLVLLIVAALAQAQADKAPSERCPAEQEFTMECNRCWCLDTAPVCTRMDCKLVPKELWGKVPTAENVPTAGKLHGFWGGLFKVAGRALLEIAGMDITSRVVHYVNDKIG